MLRSFALLTLLCLILSHHSLHCQWLPAVRITQELIATHRSTQPGMKGFSNAILPLGNGAIMTGSGGRLLRVTWPDDEPDFQVIQVDSMQPLYKGYFFEQINDGLWFMMYGTQQTRFYLQIAPGDSFTVRKVPYFPPPDYRGSSNSTWAVPHFGLVWEDGPPYTIGDSSVALYSIRDSMWHLIPQPLATQALPRVWFSPAPGTLITKLRDSNTYITNDAIEFRPVAIDSNVVWYVDISDSVRVFWKSDKAFPSIKEGTYFDVAVGKKLFRYDSICLNPDCTEWSKPLVSVKDSRRFLLSQVYEHGLLIVIQSNFLSTRDSLARRDLHAFFLTIEDSVPRWRFLFGADGEGYSTNRPTSWSFTNPTELFFTVFSADDYMQYYGIKVDLRDGGVRVDTLFSNLKHLRYCYPFSDRKLLARTTYGLMYSTDAGLSWYIVPPASAFDLETEMGYTVGVLSPFGFKSSQFISLSTDANNRIVALSSPERLLQYNDTAHRWLFLNMMVGKPYPRGAPSESDSGVVQLKGICMPTFVNDTIVSYSEDFQGIFRAGISNTPLQIQKIRSWSWDGYRLNPTSLAYATPTLMIRRDSSGYNSEHKYVNYGGAYSVTTDWGTTWHVCTAPFADGILKPNVAQLVHTPGGLLVALHGWYSDSLDEGTGDNIRKETAPGGIWRSDDGGLTWAFSRDGLGEDTWVWSMARTRQGSLLACASLITQDMLTKETIGAGVRIRTDRLYRSTDIGITWHLVHDSPSLGRGHLYGRRSLLTDSTTGWIYASTINREILRSTDDGLSWQNIDPANLLGRSTPLDITLRRNGEVAVGTTEGVVLIQDPLYVTSVESSDGTDNDLGRPYLDVDVCPNPTSSSVKITIYNPYLMKGNINSASIYDVNGQPRINIIPLLRGNELQKRIDLEVGTAQLETGVFILTISGNGRRASRKFVVVR